MLGTVLSLRSNGRYRQHVNIRYILIYYNINILYKLYIYVYMCIHVYVCVYICVYTI